MDYGCGIMSETVNDMTSRPVIVNGRKRPATGLGLRALEMSDATRWRSANEHRLRDSVRSHTKISTRRPCLNFQVGSKRNSPAQLHHTSSGLCMAI